MELGEDIQEIFFLECADLLSDLNSRLSVVEQGDSDIEDLNAIFRAVHSIKGGAGSFNLNELVDFAHIYENVLHSLRSGDAEIDDAVTTLLLQSADVLSDLVDWSQARTTIDPSSYASTLKALEDFSAASNEGKEEEEEFTFAPVTLQVGGGDAPSADFNPLDAFMAPAAAIEPAGFDLKFTPSHALYKAGLNSFRLVKSLTELGATDVVLHDDAVPALDDYDPTQVYIHWTMSFPASVTRDDVDDILFFAADKGEFEFTDIAGPAGLDGLPDLDALPGLPSLPELPELGDTPSPFGDTNESETGFQNDLAVKNDITSADVTSETDGTTDIKASEVEAPVAEASDVVEASEVEDPSESTEKKTVPEDAKAVTARKAPPPTIRVVLDKIDRLINQVGELVVTQAMLDESISDTGLERDPAVMSTISDFRQLTVDIQESVMAIRAQPIRSLFQRMGRVVRESAQAVDKNAKLVLEGEYTEVDNTIIESLSDPLMHMLRNAVDHGLEKPDARAAANKPSIGIVRLSAAHRGGKVVIEVADDGAGVNREKVRSIAEKKGLIEPDSVMSDAEIDNILFMPGFSTADNVSTLSGRGVGMDVVKRSIQEIGGKVSIRSTPGEGSCITITLPLTLAILDGMLVRVGQETLVLSLTSVVETVLAPSASIHDMGNATRMVDIRGTLLPLIDLGAYLGFPSLRNNEGNAVIVVVEGDGDRWCALQVDAIIDQRQVVIKSLEENYGRVDSVSAATILGDGRLALIIDTEQISEMMVARIAPRDETDDRVRSIAHG